MDARCESGPVSVQRERAGQPSSCALHVLLFIVDLKFFHALPWNRRECDWLCSHALGEWAGFVAAEDRMAK